MPLDDTTLNYGNGGGPNRNWDRVCERMVRVLKNHQKYREKLPEIEHNPKRREIKEKISCIGVTVAEARILVEEGKGDIVYLDRAEKTLADGRKIVDSLRYELNPLVTKARKIHDLGLKMLGVENPHYN